METPTRLTCGKFLVAVFGDVLGKPKKRTFYPTVESQGHILILLSQGCAGVDSAMEDVTGRGPLPLEAVPGRKVLCARADAQPLCPPQQTPTSCSRSLRWFLVKRDLADVIKDLAGRLPGIVR